MSFTEEEITDDLKHDISLAFNSYKNKDDKISKLRLRTILFSFVMYKSSSSEINQFIEEITSMDQDEFTFQEVCQLVFYKNKAAKAKEAEEVYDYFLQGNKDNRHKLTEKDIQNEFKNYGVGATEDEIKEMIGFMLENKDNTQEELQEDDEEEKKVNQHKHQEKKNKQGLINKDQFIAFYTAK